MCVCTENATERNAPNIYGMLCSSLYFVGYILQVLPIIVIAKSSAFSFPSFPPRLARQAESPLAASRNYWPDFPHPPPRHLGTLLFLHLLGLSWGLHCPPQPHPTPHPHCSELCPRPARSSGLLKPAPLTGCSPPALPVVEV